MDDRIKKAIEAKSKTKRLHEEKMNRVSKALIAHQKKRYSEYDISLVDQNYINSFVSDANTFLNSANDFGMEYDSAQSSISELEKRYNTVKAWMFNNKEGFNKDKYAELNKTFNNFGKGLDAFKEYYSSFSSKEEYDYYKKLNDIEKMTSDDLLVYINGESDIAYTSPDGKNVTWQNIYERKKLDEDIENQIKTAKTDRDYDRLVKEGNSLDGEIKWYGPVVGENKIASYRGEVGARMSAASLMGGRGDEEISMASYMTEDEANLYSYYLMKNGTAAADKYFERLKPALKERQQEKATDLAADFANKYPELSSLVSIGTNLVSSGEYLADVFNAVTNLSLDGMDSHSAAMSDILRSGSAEKYDWQLGDYDVFDFIYNTGMSMADSMVAGLAFGGTAGGASLALSAAAHGTNDAINRGMPKWQAVLSGVSSGVFEYMFERVSLENFEAMQEVAKYSAKDIAKNIAKSMVVNASEETLTEIANIAYDTIVNGDFSNYETTIRTYMQSGMSENEARQKAALDLGAQVGEAAASGAFMGVGFSAVGNTVGRVNRANEAKALYGSSQGELVKDALEIDPGNSYAKSMQARLNNKKNLSGGQLARLAESSESTIIKKNKQQLLPIIKDKLTERGEKKGVKILSEIIAKELTGERLTSYEMKILNSNKNAQEILKEILPEGSDIIEFNRNLYNSSKPKENSTQETQHTEAQTAQEQTATESSSDNKRVSESENTALSEATLDGQAVTIKEISSVGNGSVMLRLSDGREIEADSLEFESSQDRFLYKTLAKMGVDAEGANQLIKGYVPGEETSMEDYVLGIERAFEAGKYSLPSREVMADEYANKLTKEQRALAYVLGHENAKAQTSVKQGAVDKKRSDNIQNKKQGKVHYDKTKTLSERQKVSIEALEKIADALGIQFYLFESKVDEKGNRKGANGWFDPKDGSVHIDLFAGEKGNETILFTAAHELTHFIREWSPAKFKVFADFLMEQYGENGAPITDLINKQIKKAKDNGRNIDFDTAYEELIADSCEAMLTDSNAINKFAELKAKDKKLWEKIKGYFTELLSKIKNVYNKLLPDSTEGRFVKGILSEVERLQELWTDALVDAAENYTSSDVQGEGEELYSDRTDIVDINGKEYDHVIELDYKVFNKVKRHGKDYIDFIRNNLINKKITVYDSNGNAEVIEFAKEKERVQKDGSTNFRRVLGELEQAKNSLKKLVILNSVETAEVSRFISHNTENSHQWLDRDGWDKRISYVLTKDDVVYPVELHIAKAKDGRNILYDTNIKIKEGISIDKNATSLRTKKNAEQAVKVPNPSSDDTISQNNDSVKKKFSSRNSYAPTFYSYMEKVVNGIKGEKIGSNSVVSYLRGKGVKSEEIKWSGIEQWLEGKRSVTKADLQNFVSGSQLQISEQIFSNDIELRNDGSGDYTLYDAKGNVLERYTYNYFRGSFSSKTNNRTYADKESLIVELRKRYGVKNPTRWSDYKIEGGTNYREMVFRLPNSSYTNNSMIEHWGENVEGILAHARVQDMITEDGRKMLFIEEIQSDWHNEGHKEGDSQKVPDAPFKNSYHEYVLKRLIRMAAEEGYDCIGWTPADIQSERWSEEFAEGYRIEYDQDIPSYLKKYGKKWGAAVRKTNIETGIASERDLELERLGIITIEPDLKEVWSMDITASMKESVLYEGQVLYSSRNVEESFDIKTLNDYVGVQKSVIKTLSDEGFFEKENSIVKNINSGMVVEITKDGIRETLGTGNRFQQLPRQLKKLKLATIRMLPKLIKTAEIKQDNVRNTHNSLSELMYAYLSNDVTIEDDLGISDYEITITIRKSPQKNKFLVHEVRATKKESRLSSGEEMNPQQEYNKTETLEGSVPQNSDSVKKKFSDRYSYEALTSKPDMQIKVFDEIQENEIEKYKRNSSLFAKDMREIASMENHKKNTPTLTYLHCDDLQADVLITKESFKHGAARLDGAYIALCKNISSVLRNSIVVNELNERDNTKGAYVLLGLVENDDSYIVVRSIVNKLTWKLEDYHKLYAIKKKSIKKEDVGLKPPHYIQKNGFGTSSIISISDFLSFVNSQKIANSVLSLDVLEKLKDKRGFDENVTPNLLYSDRDPEAIERMEKINEFLKEENEQLKEDVFRLEELVKIQQQVTTFTKTSVDAAANYLMNISHAKGSKKEFAKILNEFYGFIAKGEELTWYSITERAQPVIDWLYEHIGVKAQISGEAREVLDNIKGSRIYLDDMQKAEVNGIYGSYASYRNKLFGTLVLSEKDSISLDSKWQEWAELYPNYFDANTNSNDMPSRLLDVISALRKPENTALENDYTRELAEQELLQQIYDSYWRVSTMNVRADKIGEKVNALKSKHNRAIEKIKDNNRKHQEELNRAHREHLTFLKEGRDRTAMRHKIYNIVNNLNKYLLKATKEQHVPEELQKVVAETLDAVNMDTVGAEERIAQKRYEMMQAKTPEDVERIAKEIVHIQEMGDKVAEKISKLKAAYDGIINSNDPIVANSYDEIISSNMGKVTELVGNKPIRNMSLNELEAVYEMYKMVLTAVRNANKAFKAKKSESIAELGSQVMSDIKKYTKDEKLGLKGSDKYKLFAWNNLKPVYAFERLGSDTFSDIYDNVRDGEDVWVRDITEAKEFFKEQSEKYRYNSWDFKKRYSFKSTSNKAFDLSLEQIMSLYAYSKREQAAEHLKNGGIVFDETTEITIKKKLGVPIKFNPTEATAYNLSFETLTDIISKLTPEQLKFVDAMQDYLSKTMGEKGNEISLEMYGIKLFKEKHYFPLKSATQFMAKAKEQQQGNVKIKNSGFSKETVKKANNPIVLTPFMDVWAGHVNDMSMYHAFVLPLEDFYRVYNYKTAVSDLDAIESVEMHIQNAHGKAAVDYIEQLLKDLNGGARVDPRAGFINTMVGKFKKSAVMASLSVVVQQPSAIARAIALIDAKYFAGKPSNIKLNKTWKELKKYAPVAMIKEMGYFDTGMGQSSVEWIKDKKTFMDKIDTFASWLPSKADELGWCWIWDAVKRETLYEHKTVAPNSEEFWQIAGKRFTEVITKTQVYDSVLSRSGFMRSKDTGMKMATAFMAEPTTSLNMITNAIIQAKRGKGREQAARTIGSVAASMIVNSILVSFVYAARDDDDEKTYSEKYISTLLEELLDSINPLSLAPYIKDIISIFQGYDVERSDMAVVTDLFNAWKNLSKDSRSPYRKVEDFAGAVAAIFGLPVKNVMRDARGIFNTVVSIMNGEKTTLTGINNAITEALKGKDISNAKQLYNAIINEDLEQIERVKKRFENQKAINSAIRSQCKEEYIAGKLDSHKAQDILSVYTEFDDLSAELKVKYWQFMIDYPELSLLAEESWINKYNMELTNSGVSIEQFVDYKIQIQAITGKNRKQQIMQIINTLPITKKQKDALYYAEGWAESTIDDAPWN